MSDFLDRISKLSPKRLALLALEQQEQIETAARREHEPIAIVGMACRLPGGVQDAGTFWKLLKEGRDAIREVPRDRWNIDEYYDPDPDAPARMSVRNGGFLDDIGSFDPAFFGIAPREALTMDPQQRLLLEISWQALENAGIAPDKLVGSATGVFVGICNSDHFNRVLTRGAGAIDAYLASGNAHSVAAGRISYCLGLQGPALSIDTACSSSLVAIHVACKSLRSDESKLALAAGVNVMCSPETTIALSKAHMLAPDGRCKTFDASADGFARGEGCGVLVLKRLEDALADGDRVLALIRGTAANQDGRSGGLTVPNGPAQEAVIRMALADAGAQASEIDYVEAHGTGTTLGDPIEVRALSGALGAGRTAESPLWIGSVKTNIGHLESAAGIAGVMKVVLALQNERIPPHLHFTQPSPHIAWSEYPVRVAPAGRDWMRGPRARLAGVSSFGFSGTNAHVILEEAPVQDREAASSERPLYCLPISARSDKTLADLAGAQARALEAATSTLADVAVTLGAGRAHLGERAAIVARDVAEARAAFAALSAGSEQPAVLRGSVQPGSTPEIVFLYTGQGSQYPGMCRALYAGSEVVRQVIDECDAALGVDERGRSLKSVLMDQSESSPIHETQWTQPALFAVEMAMTRLWQSWGLEPAAVIGHSLGEYAAACVAGVFTLADGIRLIAERGRLLQALPAGGSMAALFAPVDDVAAAVAPVADRVSIAAINANDSVVISGDGAAVEALLQKFAGREVRGHRLHVSFAAHSPLVEPALEAMYASAARVPMRAPMIPVAWNVTGGKPLASGPAPDAAYWRSHLREPVRFAEGLLQLHEQGFRTFLEVGPHPTLMALAQRSLNGADLSFVSSLRRGKDDWSEVFSALAQLYVRGAKIDWAAVNRGSGGRPCALPTYPFERRTYWLPPSGPSAAHVAVRVSDPARLRVERMPTAAVVYQTQLSPTAPAYLAQHVVHGAVLVAGPVFLEIANLAAIDAFGAAPRAIENFAIREPLVLPEQGRIVEVHLNQTDDGAIEFAVHSGDHSANPRWTRHATGRFVADRGARSGGASVSALQTSLGPVGSSEDYYALLASLGIEMGEAFRSVREAQRGNDEVLARVEIGAGVPSTGVTLLHPALFDGALQSVGLAVSASGKGSGPYLLTGIDRISLQEPSARALWCHVQARASSADKPSQWFADVTLFDMQGKVAGSLEGVCLTLASPGALERAVRGAGSSEKGLYYQLTWESAAAPAAQSLVAPAKFAADVRDAFARLSTANDLSIYDSLLPELDRLSLDHITHALRELRFDERVGRRFQADGEADRLGVLPRHRRLFARMLDILVEESLLRREETGFIVAATFPARDPADHYPQLLARFGAVNGELLTLKRCATELAGVLNGTQDPLQLLFPGGSLTEARQLYVESPYARTYNAALVEALRAAISKLPPSARLRILEIGAGTGGTTTYVLPALPADSVDYTFTDISPLFLDRAAEQFAAYPFARYSLLDIERNPGEQGFSQGAYDVVIAANVLHATADLTRTMQHVRGLLARDGMMFLLEGVAPERWVDLTFGFTDGWWRFTDAALRAGYPLLSRDGWTALLAKTGFNDVFSTPDSAESGRGAAQQALIVARAAPQPRTWTLVGDAGVIGEELEAALRSRGESVVRVSADGGVSVPASGEIVYLGALPLAARSRDDVDAGADAVLLAAELPRRWLGGLVEQKSGARIWLVTRGAQHVDGQSSAGARWQALLWGLGRGFALEQPQSWGGLVDLPPVGDAAGDVARLLASIESDEVEDQIAWRAGGPKVARLVPATDPASAAIAIRPDATYLITGGFGGLGVLTARWLASRGARHIALVGRNTDASPEAIRELVSGGVQVLRLAADIADEASLRAAFTHLAAQAPPLRGLIHAAATFSNAPLGVLSSQDLAAMLRPKVQGTLMLERMTRSLDLDFTVYFSSSTGLLGAGGLAHYAAANEFLDASARASNGSGRRVLSVNWGTWEAMRLASADSQRSYLESGLEPMSNNAALEALGRLLAGTGAQAMVARINWQVLKSLHEVRRARPLLAHLGNEAEAVASGKPAEAARADGTSLQERVAAAEASERRDILVQAVRAEAGAVFGSGPDDVALDVGLFEMGMDSLMSVELRKRLERVSGRKLPTTLTFNYPSVIALAGFLERELGVADTPASVAPAPAPAARAAERTVANDANLSSLSDDELEARLLARLSEAR